MDHHIELSKLHISCRRGSTDVYGRYAQERNTGLDKIIDVTVKTSNRLCTA
jgi:hypothetical protein